MPSTFSKLAPIALFCFRRPRHLEQTILSLQANRQYELSPIFVYGDGPRNEEDVANVLATRETARRLLGGRAHFIFRDRNLGLSQSIIQGVEELTDRYGCVIVIEDDLHLDDQFLSFMNDALKQYRDHRTVMHVSGYIVDIEAFAERCAPVFLPFPSSWGWATWKRAWQSFDPKAIGWHQLRRNRPLRNRFNLRGAFDYATMLERQMQGQRDSWAIRWYWSVFQAGGLSVFPPQTLVRNIGFDGSGTHGRGLFRKFGRQAASLRPRPIEFPSEPMRDETAYELVRRAIWRDNGGLMGQGVDILRRLLKN